jgi:glycosyltransferase involved in cell wall biosynthesis
MNILHLSNVIGESKGGGVHEVVSNLYKYQKSLNHHPHIWYPGDKKDGDSIRLDENIKNLETFGNSNYGVVKDLFRSLPDEINEFDIIHQHGIWKPISLYSKKIRRKLKIKSVIQPHGYLEPFRLNISKYKKRIVYNLFERSNLNDTNALVACAFDEAYKLKKLFPKKDIAVVPNGISLDFFYADKDMPIEKKKNRMLFLSQIIPIKGLERLFRVIHEIGIKKFIDWEFLIAGYEDKNHTVFLKKLIKELNLSDLITFVGPMLGQKKIRIFDSADLFILPTYNENYGIVVAEALSRGVPVLTTKGTPWEELNSHDCGYWVDNNEEGIKKGLLKILQTSQTDLKAMGSRGKKLIKSKYLWSETSKRTIELYSWVLNIGQRPDFII